MYFSEKDNSNFFFFFFLNGKIFSTAEIGPVGWVKQKGSEQQINSDYSAAMLCSFITPYKMQWNGQHGLCLNSGPLNETYLLLLHFYNNDNKCLQFFSELLHREN